MQLMSILTSKHKYDVEDVTKQGKQKTSNFLIFGRQKNCRYVKTVSYLNQKHLTNIYIMKKGENLFLVLPRLAIRFAISRLMPCIKLISQEMSTNSTSLLCSMHGTGGPDDQSC